MAAMMKGEKTSTAREKTAMKDEGEKVHAGADARKVAKPAIADKPTERKSMKDEFMRKSGKPVAQTAKTEATGPREAKGKAAVGPVLQHEKAAEKAVMGAGVKVVHVHHHVHHYGKKEGK